MLRDRSRAFADAMWPYILRVCIKGWLNGGHNTCPMDQRTIRLEDQRSAEHPEIIEVSQTGGSGTAFEQGTHVAARNASSRSHFSSLAHMPLLRPGMLQHLAGVSSEVDLHEIHIEETFATA